MSYTQISVPITWDVDLCFGRINGVSVPTNLLSDILTSPYTTSTTPGVFCYKESVFSLKGESRNVIFAPQSKVTLQQAFERAEQVREAFSKVQITGNTVSIKGHSLFIDGLKVIGSIYHTTVAEMRGVSQYLTCTTNSTDLGIYSPLGESVKFIRPYGSIETSFYQNFHSGLSKEEYLSTLAKRVNQVIDRFKEEYYDN